MSFLTRPERVYHIPDLVFHGKRGHLFSYMLKMSVHASDDCCILLRIKHLILLLFPTACFKM